MDKQGILLYPISIKRLAEMCDVSCDEFNGVGIASPRDTRLVPLFSFIYLLVLGKGPKLKWGVKKIKNFEKSS